MNADDTDQTVFIQLSTYRNLDRPIVAPQGSCVQKIARCETYVHCMPFNSFSDGNFGIDGAAQVFFRAVEGNGLVWSIAAERRKCCDFACSPMKTTQNLVPKV